MNIRNIFGAALILLGILVFTVDSWVFSTGYIFTHFWPILFVFPLGIMFHWMYFSLTDRKGVGLLVPGGVLIVVGLVCQISTMFDIWEYTWPGFILAPALGLFELYWFGNRNKWLLLPVFILTGLSMIFFGTFSIGAVIATGTPIVAVVIILIGLYLLLGSKSRT